MIAITPEQRRALRARAHALNPVVTISQNGLSDSVLKEIDQSLKTHELIKIRVFGDDRELRNTYLSNICEQLGAASVQHIGKLLVVWRPSPEKKAALKTRTRKPEVRKNKRSFQGNTHS